MKVREIVKRIEADGWFLARALGSHHQYKHPTKRGLVTVAGKPGDGLAPGTQNSIFKPSPITMNRYLIVIEDTATGFSAYSPDLPGCIATGRTREEVQREMGAAVEFHVEGLRSAGETVPEPRSQAAYCETAA